MASTCLRRLLSILWMISLITFLLGMWRLLRLLVFTLLAENMHYTYNYVLIHMFLLKSIESPAGIGMH